MVKADEEYRRETPGSLRFSKDQVITGNKLLTDDVNYQFHFFIRSSTCTQCLTMDCGGVDWWLAVKDNHLDMGSSQ